MGFRIESGHVEHYVWSGKQAIVDADSSNYTLKIAMHKDKSKIYIATYDGDVRVGWLTFPLDDLLLLLRELGDD